MAQRKPRHDSGYGQKVVAVFRDRASADAGVRAARDAGIPPDRIVVGSDEVVALRAEMREEAETITPGPAPVATRRATRRIGAALPIGAVIGAILVGPFGLLDWASIHVLLRVLIAAAAGAAAGMAVALVLGGGLAAWDADEEPLAAEHGVTLSIRARTADEGERLAELLRRHDPIRVDLATAFDQPTDTVTSEDEPER